jgi:hypothetical protein
MSKQTQRTLVNASEVTIRLMFDHNSIAVAYNRKSTLLQRRHSCWYCRDILVGLLPEGLNTLRYNDLKTDLQGLLEKVPAAVRCPAVVEPQLCRKEDWMWRPITWPLRSPDVTPRILHVCRTYGTLMNIPLPSAVKWTVEALNTCCNYGSPILILIPCAIWQ